MPRHMYTKINNKFEKYIPFGNDSVHFHFLRSDNVLQRELMKNFYEVDVFIVSNIEEIRDVVKGNNRIRNDNWDGCEIQSSRYEIQLSFDDSKPSNCWDKICSDLDVGPKGYKPTIKNAMRSILEFAKQRTKADVGHEEFKNG